MSNDQSYIDHLYAMISAQKLRCLHFSQISPQLATSSVWNKTVDETAILTNMVEMYMNYYRKKATEIKDKLKETKEYNVSSYLTYDSEYYVNEYNRLVEQVDKYLTLIDGKTNEEIMKEKLNFISDDIEYLFPKYMVDTTLREHFVSELFEEEKKEEKEEEKKEEKVEDKEKDD